MIRSILLILLLPSILYAAIKLGGNNAPDDTKVEIQCDLQLDQRIKNIGSRVDGAGMCVKSSIEMAARWQGLEQLRGIRDWCAQYPGGSYPSKVDKQIKEFCKAKNIEVPPYVQKENANWEDVKKVLSSGRIACVTYNGNDGVRYSGTIAHMVCCVHNDGVRVALLDNNGIGENELLWMTPQEFDRRFKGNGGGWLFYWKAPPPPPIPRN